MNLQEKNSLLNDQGAWKIYSFFDTLKKLKKNEFNLKIHVPFKFT